MKPKPFPLILGDEAFSTLLGGRLCSLVSCANVVIDLLFCALSRIGFFAAIFPATLPFRSISMTKLAVLLHSYLHVALVSAFLFAVAAF